MIAALLAIIWLHWLADFCLQTDAMAKSKSKSWWALAAHCLSYGVPFVVVFGFEFGMLNVAAHFLIDAATSRVTGRIWKSMTVTTQEPGSSWPLASGRTAIFRPAPTTTLHRPQLVRYFFMVVGFDQALHYTVFVLSLVWVFGR